ncbi:hypothetical protein ACFPM7_07490 [Actinokineospora guangxiensis]|uniref:PE family protein n=1 Tax=Actinokineospora guangxiensis TaxID=1490288 RepID=A0ABW0EL25_9PSEU
MAMPDGTGTEPTEQPAGSDEQIDQQVTTVEFMENMPFFGTFFSNGYQSGGGGEGGHFAISSLAELDALIARWEGIIEKIDSSGRKLDAALQFVRPPAQDGPSQTEAEKTRNSLIAAQDHNLTMGEYALNYVKKLKAARSDYATTEDVNTSTVNNSGD